MNAGRATPLLAVVIPTANRAELAIAACESLVEQTGCDFHVFVSDNSTDAQQVRRLADACAAFDRSRVTYLRPPVPLRMATHWDWALRQAMQRSATHFCIHYDRRVTKPDQLRLLYDVVTAFPDDLITTMTDSVVNLEGKSRGAHIEWDGRVYAVPTAHIVETTVRGAIYELGQAFPWLSNCTVPRAVLERIAATFSSICDSTTPDSCFAYRFCATHDRFLHFDRAIGILYGYHRSIGVGYLRGSGRDFDRFMQLWGDRPWLDAAPIPGLTLGQNIVFHEYELVRRATGHPAFKPVDREGYLRELSRDLVWINDRQRGEEIISVLSQHGWTPACMPRPSRPRATRVRDGLPWLRTLVQDLMDEARPRISALADSTASGIRFRDAVLKGIIATQTGLRRARARFERLLADHLRLAPRHLSDFELTSDEDAIRYVIAWPRPRSPRNALTWIAQRAVDVTPPSLLAKDRA